MTTLKLARQPDLKWHNARLIRQKLMKVTAERETGTKRSGNIEVDDALLDARQIVPELLTVDNFPVRPLKTSLF